ncbi:hypothetical protein [Hyalangium rubrum]|uniref:Uncharacterized protein n=1 Tax=Hyalangium rubrum TaxID=3103134 RepID=A0ABU5H354_9BACT|nr:hypothetical protein [Hyalangium sp. s54d21]MDY7227916.1 hypothetical protein [Hyalangium sp. s54d21]
MLVKVDKWDSGEHGTLDEAAVRRLFQPNENYRISRDWFPAGAEFSGASRECTCFILAGGCMLRGDGYEISLTAGAVVHQPEGGYKLKTQAGVEMVRVWLLPPALRPYQ